MKKKILIADDDKHMLSGLTGVLEMAGYEVISAENGLQVLEHLKTSQPDLFILDINMPEMDGASLVYELKMKITGIETPVIFLSGMVSDDNIGQMMNCFKNTQFLRKPCTPEELLGVVRGVLDKKP